jgi:hypothetical protein
MIMNLSPSIIRMMKSRRMRWPGHMPRMGRRGMHVGGYWWEERKKETTRAIEDVGGWIILKWVLDRTGWYGVDLSGSG